MADERPDPEAHELLRFILSHLQFDVPSERVDAFAAKLAELIQKRYGTPIRPHSGESLALSLERPKTAALAFDRIYRLPVISEPPEAIAFYGGSTEETVLTAAIFTSYVLITAGMKLPAKFQEPLSASDAERGLRLLSGAIQKRLGARPTIFYGSQPAQMRDFPPGPEEVLTAALENLEVVDEESLSWEQVMEFRRDSEARAKYRRLIRWLDSELKSQQASEIIGLLDDRLDDYGWALRKHGIQSGVGALSCLVDPKFLVGTSATVAAAAIAGGNAWAALAGASLGLGRALISFGKSYVTGVDERRSRNYEIAYVHEIKKTLG